MRFEYRPILPLGRDETRYLKLTSDFVKEIRIKGKKFLELNPQGLRFLAREALFRVNFYFRPSHLDNLAALLDDPQASANDKYVAALLLKNAIISAEGLLPLCQDTGTATITGYKGERVITGADDAKYLSQGVFEA
ncbi:MAG: fumarate hydratase, partial [Candidatus Saccharicenans sp.]